MITFEHGNTPARLFFSGASEFMKWASSIFNSYVDDVYEEIIEEAAREVGEEEATSLTKREISIAEAAIVVTSDLIRERHTPGRTTAHRRKQMIMHKPKTIRPMPQSSGLASRKIASVTPHLRSKRLAYASRACERARKIHEQKMPFRHYFPGGGI